MRSERLWTLKRSFLSLDLARCFDAGKSTRDYMAMRRLRNRLLTDIFFMRETSLDTLKIWNGERALHRETLSIKKFSTTKLNESTPATSCCSWLLEVHKIQRLAGIGRPVGFCFTSLLLPLCIFYASCVAFLISRIRCRQLFDITHNTSSMKALML